MPRNYGDPAAEYAAARSDAALVDRSERLRLRLYGRDPVRMIQGLVSNDVAGAPPGQGVYAAVLTPKGKMIADVRVFRRREADLLLDGDAGAGPALVEHLRRSVPPLFARFEDVSGATGLLGVYGPRARTIVLQALDVELAAQAPEHAFAEARFEDREVLVARTHETGDLGYEIFAPAEKLEGLWRALSRAGARPTGHATLDVLRIEAGRPRWGAELDATAIPLEAGLRQRAISETKGCYTGQEVIIRILHRGHVNWLLRGVLLGDAPAPAGGAALLQPADGKMVGRITSSCYSPRQRQTIALAYVRREVEPPAALRLVEAAGPQALVVELPFPSSDMGGPVAADVTSGSPQRY
ncbi:MAG: aminomethyl transferase family protein [Gemmatimonadetes bacterium]|nr:aminomethyl transferase family protein [Gemmatimonadota bacterium]